MKVRQRNATGARLYASKSTCAPEMVDKCLNSSGVNFRDGRSEADGTRVKTEPGSQAFSVQNSREQVFLGGQFNAPTRLPIAKCAQETGEYANKCTSPIALVVGLVITPRCASVTVSTLACLCVAMPLILGASVSTLSPDHFHCIAIS